MTGAQTSATLGGHNCTRPDPLSAAAGAQPPRIAAHRPSRSAKRPVCLSLHGSIHALPIERLASTGRRTHACGHRHRQGKQPWPQNSGKGILFSSRHGAPIASGHLLKPELCANVQLVLANAKQHQHMDLNACMIICTTMIHFSIHPALLSFCPEGLSATILCTNNGPAEIGHSLTGTMKCCGNGAGGEVGASYRPLHAAPGVEEACNSCKSVMGG